MKEIIFSMIIGGIIGHIITKQKCEIEVLRAVQKMEREIYELNLPEAQEIK